MNYSIDTSRWPLVTAVMPVAPTDAEMEAVLEELESLYSRKERFAVVLDMPFESAPSLSQLGMSHRYLKRTEDREREYSLGVALVVRSAIVRIFLAATYEIVVPVSPRAVFETTEEATAWCVERLRAKGIALAGAV